MKCSKKLYFLGVDRQNSFYIINDEPDNYPGLSRHYKKSEYPHLMITLCGRVQS